MKRFGLQWDSARIDNRTYVHVGLYVDSPTKSRTSARIAAVIFVILFMAVSYYLVPDVDIHTPQITEVRP